MDSAADFRIAHVYTIDSVLNREPDSGSARGTHTCYRAFHHSSCVYLICHDSTFDLRSVYYSICLIRHDTHHCPPNHISLLQHQNPVWGRKSTWNQLFSVMTASLNPCAVLNILHLVFLDNNMALKSLNGLYYHQILDWGTWAQANETIYNQSALKKKDKTCANWKKTKRLNPRFDDTIA